MKMINQGGHDAYLLSGEEIVSLLRYIRTEWPSKYFVIHTDNPDPKYTGGIIHEGITSDSMSTTDLETVGVGECCVTVKQGDNLTGIKVKDIRTVELGKTVYWHVENEHVKNNVRSRLPIGSDLVPKWLEEIIVKYRPDWWPRARDTSRDELSGGKP